MFAAAPMVWAGPGSRWYTGWFPGQNAAKLMVLPFKPRQALDIVLVRSTTLPPSRFGRDFARDIQAVVHDLGRAEPEPTDRSR
ncbi:hypothetical protein [Mesorhizobium sp. M0643]|uniref:hypothetical protein n=2 Tax=Mesorhizobium TaxID=68287 RepID=UPI00333DB1B5